MKIVKLTKKFFVHYETVKFYYRVPSKHRWSLSWARWNQSAPLRIPLRSTTMWPALSSDIYYDIPINEGLQTQILINLPIPCTIQHLLFTCQRTLTTPRVRPIHLWSLTITIFTVGFQDDTVTTMLTISKWLPWWWFLREPKHVGATVGILIVLIFLWFYNCVHRCGTIKSALILLMHGRNMKNVNNTLELYCGRRHYNTELCLVVIH
jgi:hypothetical protein